MGYVERLVHQERLMTRMAEANGADIDLALLTGALSPEELHDATLRCMGCTQSSSCERWVEASVDGVPDYCRNTGMISEVREVLHSQD